jgi:hypothetical protein
MSRGRRRTAERQRTHRILVYYYVDVFKMMAGEDLHDLDAIRSRGDIFRQRGSMSSKTRAIDPLGG